MKYLSTEFPRLSSRMLWIVAVLGLGNLPAFFVASYLLGGDAVTGRSGELGNHGKYVPVGELTYWFSYLHAISLFVSVPLGALAARALERRADPLMSRWGGPISQGVAAGAVACGLAWQVVDIRPLVGIPVALALGVLAFARANRGDGGPSESHPSQSE